MEGGPGAIQLYLGWVGGDSKHLEKQLNIALRKTLKAILKRSFGPVSVLGPRFNSSEYFSMRVEDPVNSRGGLNLGPAFLSRLV